MSVCVSVCEIPEPGHVSICVYMGEGCHIPEDGDAAFSLFSVRTIFNLGQAGEAAFLIDASRSASSRGLKFREHTNLTDYEGGAG